MSQFSDHDPAGQAVRAAAGVTRYERSGWRRWLVPTVLVVVAIAAASLGLALLTG